MESPRELSRELRKSHHPFLRDHRVVFARSLGAASVGGISLYQMGLIRYLPEPPLARLDADTVVASDEAYARLSTPDAVLGFASFGVTMVLAAMGGPDRARRRPWVPLAMAAKVTADALYAARRSVDQWTKYRAFCSWCLAAAALAIANVPRAIPEARTALEEICR